MRNIFQTFFFLLLFNDANSQSFINGNFETNKATICTYNMPDTTFNKMISNVYAFGKTIIGGKNIGEADLQTNACYVTPQSGNWCVGIASDFEKLTTSDAVALELNSALVVGNTYQLSFYLFGNTYNDSIAGVTVGESMNSTGFGKLIGTASPDTAKWKKIIIDFKASTASKFITVKNIPGKPAWNQIDNFDLLKTGDIKSKLITGNIQVYPNPSQGTITIDDGQSGHFISASIFDLDGREIIRSSEKKFDISSLLPGMYCLEVITDSGRTRVRIMRGSKI